LGTFSLEELDGLIYESARIANPGERIDFLSRKFLNTDYAEATLIGDKDTPEIFVINLEEVDCMTFIEYIEAMRLSSSYQEFESNLRRVRYGSGIVEFINRNHFFTDWKEFNPGYIKDVSETIGGGKTVRIQKMLNVKEDGAYFLPGIRPVEREILYIPSEAVDLPILKKLRSGDYIGIYSALSGLDVSHVGIVVRDGENLFLRHASSKKEYRKVIDQDFRTYVADKPGIIVFRPKNIEHL
jgi:hypothetical protein